VKGERRRWNGNGEEGRSVVTVGRKDEEEEEEEEEEELDMLVAGSSVL
jgi:hypothetical protein